MSFWMETKYNGVSNVFKIQKTIAKPEASHVPPQPSLPQTSSKQSSRAPTSMRNPALCESRWIQKLPPVLRDRAIEDILARRKLSASCKEMFNLRTGSTLLLTAWLAMSGVSKASASTLSPLMLQTEQQELVTQQQVVNNPLFTSQAVMPSPLEIHGNAMAMKTQNGIFVHGANFHEILQGRIGDCFYLASMDAVTFVRPDWIPENSVLNDDGSITTRFFDSNHQPHLITVDPSLYLQNPQNQKHLYARTGEDPAYPGERDDWAAIYEKSLAVWNSLRQHIDPSYNAIDGVSLSQAASVLETITGAPARTVALRSLSEEQLEAVLSYANEHRLPIVVGTKSDVHKEGLVSTHAYAVHEDGRVKRVPLRNPWGEKEPAGNGPDDGEFSLTIQELKDSYSILTIGSFPDHPLTAEWLS